MSRDVLKTIARVSRRLRSEHLVELILIAILITFKASSTSVMAAPQRNWITSFVPALVDGVE